MQADNTMFGADASEMARHRGWVLSHDALIAEMQRLKDAGRTTNADLARVLKVPSSRVAEIFSGKRQVKVDEMKLLVDRFGLEGAGAIPSVDTLEPILDAILPLAPPGRVTDQSRRALAEALSYGLALLGAHPASQGSSDAVAVAARAAAARFRDLALQ